jgi:cytochrome bd-type quinol oxidase subunit 2
MTSQPKNTLPTATRLYWYAFGLCSLLLFALAGLAWFALDAGENIEERINQYRSFGSKLFYINLISFLVLLVLAAYHHKKYSKVWFYIPGLLLFIFVASVHYTVLNEKLFLLKQAYDMDGGSFSMNQFLAIGLSIISVLMTAVVMVGVKLLGRKN